MKSFDSKIRFLCIAAFAFFLAALSPAASAQEDDCDDSASEDSDEKNYKTVIDENGQKVFVIEKAFVVCGKVPKPNVIYVLQASTINYEWESLKKDFLPKVLRSVTEAPF